MLILLASALLRATRLPIADAKAARLMPATRPRVADYAALPVFGRES